MRGISSLIPSTIRITSEADFWHFSFSNSFCNTSVCLSRAIRKSDRLDFLSLLCLCLTARGTSFSYVYLVLLFGDVYHDVKDCRFHTLILQRLLQTGVLLLQQQQFLASSIISCSFVFGISFPFMFSQSNVPYFSNQRFTVVSLCIPYFATALRPMLVVSLFRTTDSFERYAVIFLRPFLILFSFFSFCYFL